LTRLRRVPLSAVLFFCLAAAVVVTAVLVIRARTPNLVLEVTHPGPLRFKEATVDGPDVRIAFFVREADGHAQVAIVDGSEDVVRTLDGDVALAKREEVSYIWDRSTDAGGEAPPGRYRLQVSLPSEDRVMIWPRRITLVPQTGGEG
jgi:hypothetical protein